MISVRFQGKPFSITVIQVYAPTANAKEVEVEQFYKDLQDLLELTPKKDVFFIIGCQGPALVYPGNSKVGTVSASLEKYIFNYRYRERLETDSVVGSLVEKKRLNNLD